MQQCNITFKIIITFTKISEQNYLTFYDLHKITYPIVSNTTAFDL